MKRLSALVAALALVCVALPARAGPEEDEAAQSRAYFETGAKEYEKGNYPNAIRAFEQAYALTKRPGLLFSIAQSYKRNYANDPKTQFLRKALDYYRRYLAEDKTGKRRGEAAAAIGDIEVMLAKLPPEETAAPAPEISQPTQISITTGAEDATISVDGSPPRPLEPVDVTPDKHKVVVQAPGYFPAEREIRVNKGQMAALDIELRPKPAFVSITGRAGADVSVDGVPRGALPLLAPLEIEAGERTIAVSMNGFVSFTEERTLGRGDMVTLRPELGRTKQRIASFVLFGAGIVTVTGGILLAVGAAGADEEARGIEAERQLEFITATRHVDYKNAVKDRNGYAAGSTVLLNGGIALGALSFLLYYFDEPKLTPPKKKDEKKKEKKDSPGMRDIAIVPAGGSGFVGLSMGGRF